ncbi:MAG: HEAT repeat domain-containing protein [Kiritimatiellia bacterium]
MDQSPNDVSAQRGRFTLEKTEKARGCLRVFSALSLHRPGFYLVGILLLYVAAPAAGGAEYPPETKFDTAVYPDEAVVNLRIRNHRWPDCYSLPILAQDIFRLEGVDDTEDATAAKAIACWKWVMTLMSPGGGRIFEGNPKGPWVREGDPERDQIEVRHGDKLLLVYGCHECGGLSRVLASLWCAAGYLGYQEADAGHSTAALRYPDNDGVWRMHSFNPQGRSYYWDPQHNRVGTRRRPVMRGVEYKQLLPSSTHTLRTSLRRGERVVRRWENDGYLQMTELMNYWEKRPPPKQLAAHCVVGQEDQTLSVLTDPALFHTQLWEESENVACSSPAPGLASLHPAEANRPARFVYRLASPYVAIECEVRGRVRTTGQEDVCRLEFSTDMGRTWHCFYEKVQPGEERIELRIGRERYWKPEPSITSRYTFLIRAVFQTRGDPRQVGMDELLITVHRQLNMRALPNLMPGENVWKIEADALAPGLGLEVRIDYEVNGEPRSLRRFVTKLPHYFRVDVTNLPTEKLLGQCYLAEWGDTYRFNLPSHPLRMRAISVAVVSAESSKPDESLPLEEAEQFFRKAYPNPYLNDRRMSDPAKVPQYDSEVSGFLPQLHRTGAEPSDALEYYNWLVERIGTMDVPLPKLPPGTDPIEWCVRELPRAPSARTMGICNVLAHFADRRALAALLAKWGKAPEAGPGDRYVPDALAAIGERSVVRALADKLHKLTYDYRLHVAHALGILGGPEARRVLEKMAQDDPNISVRGEAKRALALLAGMKPDSGTGTDG